MTHVVVDDGSSDGTTHAIQDAFPDVEIVRGSGNLYWAGGMRYGWEKVVKDMEFDALLVYNDDVRFNSNSIATLIEVSNSVREYSGSMHVIVGAFVNYAGNESTYGGWRRCSRWHPLWFERVGITGRIEQVDTLNMNAALITGGVLKKVGFLSDYFIHSNADFEYGLKLSKVGGSIWQTPNAIGYCERNVASGTSRESGISTTKRLSRLMSVKEHPIKQKARYYREHGGIFWQLLLVLFYISLLKHTK